MAASLEANQQLFAQREAEWGSVRHSLWVMFATLGFQHKPIHILYCTQLSGLGVGNLVTHKDCPFSPSM